MSGAHRTLQFGPATYEVSEPVTGGQLVAVDPDNAGKVKVADAATDAVLGVATADANTAANQPGQVDASFPQKLVAVGYGPAEYRLTASGAIGFGDLVVAAADGQVAGAGATPGVGTIVGRCTEPGGAEAANDSVRVRLYI